MRLRRFSGFFAKSSYLILLAKNRVTAQIAAWTSVGCQSKRIALSRIATSIARTVATLSRRNLVPNARPMWVSWAPHSVNPMIER